MNLALMDWKALYTTNYDELIEASYEKRNKELLVYASNFDFTVRGKPTATRLYKLHGTIGKDIVDGNVARIILTDSDYSYTKEYRQKLYDTLRADLAESKLIIIGYSLSDQHIRDIIARAIELNEQAMSGGRIALLMYEADEDRALLYESKGFRVVFAGIDEFFGPLAGKIAAPQAIAATPNNPVLGMRSLQLSTVDVEGELVRGQPNITRMFNGWAASYADISGGLTFVRSIGEHVAEYLLKSEGVCAILLGAAGVGKTTAARQVVERLRAAGLTCWEHKVDETLQVSEWVKVARELGGLKRKGILFVDDAHTHLYELNDLINELAASKADWLKILVTSTRSNWRPRVKSANFFRVGREFYLSQLDAAEIDRLLVLVEQNNEIRRLVEDSFIGFSLQERRRRLVERCEADMFVCMRNIFASDKFDDIILRDYADLPHRYQEIYRVVAALESAGVRVHRQMVIRLLNLPMTAVETILNGLLDIVTEYTINAKDHIYGWRGRHLVIDEIITKHKFADPERLVELFERVIDNLVPTYDVEIRSIRELCNLENGIRRIPNKREQNRLLRKMISVAPGERVPRHRLIRNLIDLNEFDGAETEIRMFDKDFGHIDGPIARYKINMMVARAMRAPGIMTEDRLTILGRARELAASAVQRYQNTPQVFGAYCEVGIEILRLSGRREVFDEAMIELRKAEERVGDPELGRIAIRYNQQLLRLHNPAGDGVRPV